MGSVDGLSALVFATGFVAGQIKLRLPKLLQRASKIAKL
jgi:hypothetical protein